MDNFEGFIVRPNGGFRITFKNNYGVDLCIGGGSYSDNYECDIFTGNNVVRCKNCEIAIMHNDKFLDDDTLAKLMGCDDTVAGHIKADDLLDILNKVAKL